MCARLNQIDNRQKARSILKLLQDTVRKSKPSWNNDWSASFFTDAKYVGYKDDASLRGYVEDGSWARAYIGEYSRASQKLTLNPLDPKKLKTISIGLP